MKTLHDGSRELLAECVRILEDPLRDVVFVGGWGPCLRNPERHPGTLDVDILFPPFYTREDIKVVVERFLEHSFFLSAKHSFQLFRDYSIGLQRYAFNVDFLHPVLEDILVADFQDIMELDVTIDGRLAKKFLTVGIVHGHVLFEDYMNVTSNFNGHKIRTLSPCGVVFSKLQSCASPKRPRDIFDILLSCDEQSSVWNTLKDLALIDKKAEHILSTYTERFESRWPFFVDCLNRYSITATSAIKELLSGKV